MTISAQHRSFPVGVSQSAHVPRQVRAQFTDATVRVYQVVPRDFGDAALDAGTFVPPFPMGQMMWLKPSFLSQVFRWQLASRTAPHMLLAIDVKRAAFEWMLATSCAATHEPDLFPFRDAWARRMAQTSVRLQWDQDKTVLAKPLPCRSVSLGLSGETLEHYIEDWIVGLTSSEGLAQWISSAMKDKRYVEAAAHLPVEQLYPLSQETAAAIGVAYVPPLQSVEIVL